MIDFPDYDSSAEYLWNLFNAIPSWTMCENISHKFFRIPVCEINNGLIFYIDFVMYYYKKIARARARVCVCVCVCVYS